MQLHSIPSLTAFILISIPLFIAIRNLNSSSRPRERLLVVFLIQVGSYMALEYILLSAPNASTALFRDRMMYIPIILMPATFLHLVTAYPRHHFSTAWFLYYLPTFIFIMLLPTDLMLSGMKPAWFGYTKIIGPAFKYFNIYFLIYFSASIIMIIRNYFKAQNFKEKNESAWLGMSIIPPILAAILVVVIMPLFNVTALNIGFNALFVIYLSFVLTYAILHKHLFDLHVFFAPLIKTPKYFFHHNLKKLIHDIPDIKSIDQLMTRLSELFQCQVTLTLNKERPSAAEFEIPVYTENETAVVSFGEGFNALIYSRQDIQLLSHLIRRLSDIVKYLLYLEDELRKRDHIITALKRPPLIVSNGGVIQGVYTAIPLNYIYFEPQSDDPIKVLNTKQYPKTGFVNLLNG